MTLVKHPDLAIGAIYDVVTGWVPDDTRYDT